MVTVVLNGYKRGQHLETQLEAIKKQTLRPKEIMLWQNAGQDFNPEIAGKTTWASCNKNFGVWARFAYALNAKTEYVCVCDDDDESFSYSAVGGVGGYDGNNIAGCE